MKLSDRIRRWWKPAQWEDDHPLTEAERAESAAERAEREEGTQLPLGASTYDRVDVERDLRKP
jgi:hypothetical protein